MCIIYVGVFVIIVITYQVNKMPRATLHGMRGEEWKALRMKLLYIAHHGTEYDFEDEIIKSLPRKVQPFTGDSIQIDYLEPNPERCLI